jgi:acyl-CoA hydrolase
VNYDREYNDLVRTAKEAVGPIEPGDDTIVGIVAGEPQALMEVVGEHSEFSDNLLYVMLPPHELPVDVDRKKLQIVSCILVPWAAKPSRRGKTIGERTHALIDVAHPNFRYELKHKAKEIGYW